MIRRLFNSLPTIPPFLRKPHSIRHINIPKRPPRVFLKIANLLLLRTNFIRKRLSLVLEQRALDCSLLLYPTDQSILYHVIILDVVKIDVPFLVEENVRIAINYFSLFVFLKLYYEFIVELVPIILILCQTGVVTSI